ncbi:DNA mismatch repair endonuclease MutL [Penaeicola halotolerans]|uniref:DNA mismatch repair endonuclease MutL n=1 Tax=Penaeicola halotolerans TaxID=2793196 RepID=UPI001CF92310|nr:DNA mismatch repair endonuclease MutL [Penaeicola halotolerans]
MPDIIQLLPDAIANQIAAGEVVQRPASVIKELMENAVDAGAKQVQVIIKEAGKSLIQVIDDGKGMSETDARMSFERHATSKIRSADDLFAIRTFGFRGEALASIAAVAQVEMKTRQANAELGLLLVIEGSEVKKQEPVQCSYGTSIAVKNLFYNVPARRNFLKSNPVEMRHIMDEFQRVALAYPEVSFSLYQNDLETYKINAGKLSHRIVGLFGKNYQEQLVSCKEDTDHIQIHGYIGKPEFAKKTRGEQFFFVNNRFIKSSYLHHAVSGAYEGLLQSEQHPFYVLFINIDPKHIDINVHPTKTEIKFDDERTVYAIIRATVKQALGTHNVVPAIDFSLDVNFHQARTDHAPSPKDQQQAERSYMKFSSAAFSKNESAKGWEQLFDQPRRHEVDQPDRSDNEVLTFSSAANQLPDLSTSSDLVTVGQAIFQFQQRYIVAQVKQGMMFIDQQAAHERILYEKYLNSLQNKSGASQQSLFPQAVTLNKGDFELLMDLEPELKAMGFLISDFGKDTVLVNGVPADVSITNEKALLEGLIEQYKHHKNELSIDKKENLARSIAKRSGTKSGVKLGTEEMSTIMAQLFACKNPNYGLSGSKTFFILTLDKVESFFNK